MQCTSAPILPADAIKPIIGIQVTKAKRAMIQFYLSKDLAKDLASLPIEKNPPQGEADTYTMVFCGLTKPDFHNFAQLFGQRLLQEACVITQLQEPLPDADVQLLCELANEVSMEQSFACHSDRSVQSHINQVKEHLEDLVLRGGYPLPESPDDSMRFGLIANDMLRKTKNHKDYFVPLEVYADFWLGMIRHVKERVGSSMLDEGPEGAVSDTQGGGKVIAVDFVKRRRK